MLFWTKRQSVCLKDKVTIAQEETIPNIWNATVWWSWLTSKRVARVCQHQLSFFLQSKSNLLPLPRFFTLGVQADAPLLAPKTYNLHYYRHQNSSAVTLRSVYVFAWSMKPSQNKPSFGISKDDINISQLPYFLNWITSCLSGMLYQGYDFAFVGLLRG